MSLLDLDIAEAQPNNYLGANRTQRVLAHASSFSLASAAEMAAKALPPPAPSLPLNVKPSNALVLARNEPAQPGTQLLSGTDSSREGTASVAEAATCNEELPDRAHRRRRRPTRVRRR